MQTGKRMKIQKTLTHAGRLFVLLALNFANLAETLARNNDDAHIKMLKNELLSLNYDKTNAAVFELIELEEYDLICDVFPSFGESNKQVAAKGLRESGKGDLRVDRLLLAYYKSRNHWIDPSNYEQASGRDYQTFECLQYLSEKYKMPMPNYRAESEELTQRKLLPIVAEIIGRLENIISPELSPPPATPTDGQPELNPKTGTKEAVELGASSTVASLSSGQKSIFSAKNTGIVLIAASVGLIIFLVWLKRKKRS